MMTKRFFSLVMLLMLSIKNLHAQNLDTMKQKNIKTNIGTIAVYEKLVSGTIPVIFLHGVYYDHNLWNYHMSRINDRTVIAIDMPFHGKSKKIKKSNWSMMDCADMLIELLDSLGYDRVYAVGHSWGSMTILRAAAKSPERFEALGLCNMPFAKGTIKTQMKFGFQHMVLPFRKFYTKQVAKAMFSEESISKRPELYEYLDVSMSLLSNKEVKKTDRFVISKVESGIEYLDRLKVPALALKGSKDYVGTPEKIVTTVVDGAHTSPLEQPEKVFEFIEKVFRL